MREREPQRQAHANSAPQSSSVYKGLENDRLRIAKRKTAVSPCFEDSGGGVGLVKTRGMPAVRGGGNMRVGGGSAVRDMQLKVCV